MTDQTVRFGILADTTSQLDCIQQIVEAAGQRVEVRFHAKPSNIGQLPNAEVDAWVVQVSLQNDDCELAFLDVLDSLSVPVIYDDVESFAALTSEDRAKRLTRKISECVQEAGEKTYSRARAREVWVLAASTGGPEAVAQFLRAMSDDFGEVAFLYAQHINVGFEGSLQTMIMRNSRMTVYDSEKPRMLRAGCVYIVSPKHQIELHESGWMTPVHEPWPGSYSPSMDQLIAKVARRYHRNSGAIIFSGMGNDGSGSCVFMKHSGGQIWAQSPNTCTVDSMPNEAIRTNAVTIISAPNQLAIMFTRRHNLRLN